MSERVKKIIFYIILLPVTVAVFFAAAYATEKYVAAFQTLVSLEKNSDIDPQAPVVLNFSRPVLFTEASARIRIEPATGYRTHWLNNNQRLVIEPENFWRPETDYRIIYPGGRNIMLTRIQAAEFVFGTVTYPEIFNIYPKDGQKDVILDIEDPIVVDFDKSTKGFYINFVLEPALAVSYFNNTEKTQFKILPKDKLGEGQKFSFKIYARYEKDTEDNQQLLYSGSFETLPPAPATWEKDFVLRLEQARRYTQAKIETGKYIDINLSQQILSTFENGKLLDSYLISTGKRGMDTPKGNFKIYNKFPRPWSRAYSLYMPYWMAITPSGSHGIHELPEWPGGYKEGANHLGTPVSHGCVRLGVGPAEIVYNWADLGTPVVVY